MRADKNALRVGAATHWDAVEAASAHRRTRAGSEGRRAGGRPEEEPGPCEEEQDADFLWKVREQERRERRCAHPWMDVTGV